MKKKNQRVNVHNNHDDECKYHFPHGNVIITLHEQPFFVFFVGIFFTRTRMCLKKIAQINQKWKSFKQNTSNNQWDVISFALDFAFPHAQPS